VLGFLRQPNLRKKHEERSGVFLWGGEKIPKIQLYLAVTGVLIACIATIKIANSWQI
jgi:hypothetical protein